MSSQWFQCLSCGGVYLSPQNGRKYFHVCSFRPDPSFPIPGEDEQDDRPRIFPPCHRNENFDRGLGPRGRPATPDENYELRKRSSFGLRRGRGRRAIPNPDRPPPLPLINNRPCED